MFPETQAIAHARAGTHKSKFMCAMYCTHKIIVFSLFVLLLLYIFPIRRNFSSKDLSLKITERKFKT